MTGSRAREQLAEAVRELMDATVLTGADDPTLDAAAGLVRDATARLAALPREPADRTSPEELARGWYLHNPVIGTANPYAPPMVVTVCPDSSVEAHVTMRAIHEGPPGALHGGFVATLLDQLLGHATVAAGVGAMTVQLTVRYLRPTPLERPLLLRARLTHTMDRRVWASGEIVVDDTVTARAEGEFLQPSPDRVRRLANTLDPDAVSAPRPPHPAAAGPGVAAQTSGHRP